MDLDSMKYAELRSLAKELGLKANMKMDKLVKAIKQHYQQEQNKEVGVKGTEEKAATDGGSQEIAEPASEVNVFSRAVFVNTRRGKGPGAKRKISGAAAVVDAAQVDIEVAATDEPKGTKKRKIEESEDGQTRTTDNQDGKKGRPSKVTKGGKIPRSQGGQQKNKPALKPITPNFKKLHEAHFSKMESIDSYIQRKTKQMDTYRSAVKELKNLTDQTKQKQAEGRAEAKPARASVLSPAPATNRAAENRRRHTMQSAKKTSPDKAAAFKPSVISTRRINVRFSEATRENEHKRSLVKTPARLTSCVASSTPLKPAADRRAAANVKTATLSATKTPGPFVFTGNTSVSTPGTQKKTKFDLMASLSKPLTYKPHTGKLKPFGEPKENVAANKSLVSVDSHQQIYKQHRVQTRAERRNQQAVGRKQKKQDLLGARRGLVMI